MLQEFGNRTT